jgi:hypothetical protein
MPGRGGTGEQVADRDRTVCRIGLAVGAPHQRYRLAGLGAMLVLAHDDARLEVAGPGHHTHHLPVVGGGGRFEHAMRSDRHQRAGLDAGAGSDHELFGAVHAREGHVPGDNDIAFEESRCFIAIDVLGVNGRMIAARILLKTRKGGSMRRYRFGDEPFQLLALKEASHTITAHTTIIREVLTDDARAFSLAPSINAYTVPLGILGNASYGSNSVGSRLTVHAFARRGCKHRDIFALGLAREFGHVRRPFSPDVSRCALSYSLLDLRYPSRLTGGRFCGGGGSGTSQVAMPSNETSAHVAGRSPFPDLMQNHSVALP